MTQPVTAMAPGIPNLTTPAKAIVAAGDNLINIGVAAMNDGDDELRRSMPIACRNLKASAEHFQHGTRGLVTNPFSPIDRQLLVRGVRGLLAGTTDILVSYDGFDVRKMVKLATSILQRLNIVKQLHTTSSISSIDQTAKLIESDAETLKPLADERAQELRNDTHQRRLIDANTRLEYTVPLVTSSIRTACKHPDLPEAQENFAYASKELHGAVTEIITVLTATDLDDQTFNAAAGELATWLMNAKEELYGFVEDVAIDEIEAQVLNAVMKSSAAVANINHNSRVDLVLEDVDLCIEASKSEEAAAMMRIVRDKLQRGELKDVEAEIILRRQKDAEPDLHREGLSPEPAAPTQGEQVEAMCKEITVMLAELKTAPTDAAIVRFQGKLGELDTALKVAASDNMTIATLIDEHPAERLIAASEDPLVINLDPEIEYFQILTARIVEAANLVSGTSSDTMRCALVNCTATRLQHVANQLINAVKIARKDPTDEDALHQRELLRANFNTDLDTLKATVAQMVEAPLVMDADFTFIKSMADTAIKAARTGYAAAARAAVRKLRKRIGHVISVSTVELDNTENPVYKAALDAALLEVEDVDPRIDSAMQALKADVGDAATVDDFEGTLTAAVDTVYRLKTCMDRLGMPDYSLHDATAIEGVMSQGWYHCPPSIEMMSPVPVDPMSPVQSVLQLQAHEVDGPELARELEVGVESFAVEAVAQRSPARTEARVVPTMVVKTPRNLREAVLIDTPSKHNESTASALSANDSMSIFESTAEIREMPVMKAAVKLRREANKWSVVKNPIVASAKAMATAMARMAHISGRKSGDMGDMITTSKQIIAHAKDLIKWAKGLAGRCSDKRLKADISHGCERLQTFGVQLKIVASVKATSTLEDASESDAMLINTAQHLMDEGQHLVRACESASLKLLPADGEVEDIEWKRRTTNHRRSSTAKWFRGMSDSKS